MQRPEGSPQVEKTCRRMQAGLPVILLFGFGVVGLSAFFFELSPLESLWQEKRITKARVTNAHQPELMMTDCHAALPPPLLCGRHSADDVRSI